MSHREKQDRITIVGVRVHPRIGVTDAERSRPQECDADLTIWGDFEAAANEDSLERSVDYTQLVANVQETAKQGEYNLLETLAYKVVRELLNSFPIRRIRVKLRKRPASLIEKIDYIEVEIEKSVS